MPSHKTQEETIAELDRIILELRERVNTLEQDNTELGLKIVKLSRGKEMALRILRVQSENMYKIVNT